MNIRTLPKPVIVSLVLALGVLSFFLLRKPHSVCDSQLDLFFESQKGRLYPSQIKNSKRSPLLPRLIENCKMGNSPGACYELFIGMRSVLRDMQNIPSECAQTVSERAEITSALLETAQLMVRIAWGEAPPQTGSARFNWFEASDLALFCGIRDQYTRLVGMNDWETFRVATYSKLPGEAPLLVNGTCQNCDKRKSAEQVLSAEEIWSRSLFSVRCEQYR